jgi:hypothetical protein
MLCGISVCWGRYRSINRIVIAATIRTAMARLHSHTIRLSVMDRCSTPALGQREATAVVVRHCAMLDFNVGALAIRDASPSVTPRGLAVREIA